MGDPRSGNTDFQKAADTGEADAIGRIFKLPRIYTHAAQHWIRINTQSGQSDRNGLYRSDVHFAKPRGGWQIRNWRGSCSLLGSSFFQSLFPSMWKI